MDKMVELRIPDRTLRRMYRWPLLGLLAGVVAIMVADRGANWRAFTFYVVLPILGLAGIAYAVGVRRIWLRLHPSGYSVPAGWFGWVHYKWNDPIETSYAGDMALKGLPGYRILPRLRSGPSEGKSAFIPTAVLGLPEFYGAVARFAPVSHPWFQSLQADPNLVPWNLRLLVGSRKLAAQLVEAFSSASGPHYESVLCALGALAGRACQLAVRAKALGEGRAECADFYTVTSSDGTLYLMGDRLNGVLAESDPSVWRIVDRGARRAGIVQVPELLELVTHCVSSMGNPEYWEPRVPAQHRPHENGSHYGAHLWTALYPTLQVLCATPAEQPILIAMSIEEVLVRAHSVLDPRIAMILAIETALAASHWNWQEIGSSSFRVDRASQKG